MEPELLPQAPRVRAVGAGGPGRPPQRAHAQETACPHLRAHSSSTRKRHFQPRAEARSAVPGEAAEPEANVR